MRRLIAGTLLAGLLPAFAAPAAENAVLLEGNGLLRIARMAAIPDDRGFECMVAEEYAIGGVRLGDPVSALDRLGRPQRVTSGYGEDDGGGYTVYGYIYPGLAVEVVRDEVDVIEVTDPAWFTPSGLHVGMGLGDLYSAFGRVPGPNYATDKGFSFPGCPSQDGRVWNESKYFELTLDQDSRLAMIRFVTDRP